MTKKQKNSDPEQSALAERIGQLSEKADNYIHAAMLPCPASIHIQGLAGGMKEIKAELDSILKGLGTKQKATPSASQRQRSIEAVAKILK